MLADWWALRAYFFPFLSLTNSLNAALALKTGSFAAGIWISLPVCGLRPLRAAHSETLNVPKWRNTTESPFFRDSRIAVSAAATTASAFFGESCKKQKCTPRCRFWEPILAEGCALKFCYRLNKHKLLNEIMACDVWSNCGIGIGRWHYIYTAAYRKNGKKANMTVTGSYSIVSFVLNRCAM